MPWAKITPKSSGCRPEYGIAFSNARAAPSPAGSGAVMWKASAVERAAEHLGVDACAPPAGMLLGLQDQGARAFAADKAVPIDRKGPRRMFGIVDALGKRTHARKGRHHQQRKRRFGTAGDHDIGLAPLEEMIGLDDRVVAAGTGRRTGHDRAACARLHRNQTARSVGHDAGHHKRPDTSPALFDDFNCGGFHGR